MKKGGEGGRFNVFTTALYQCGMIRMFACIHDFQLAKQMLEQIDGSEGIIMTGITTALPKTTLVFHNTMIDVVVLDCTRKLTEALELSDMIRKDEHLHMRIVYMIKDLDTGIMDYLIQHEQDSTFVHAPFTVGKLLLAIAREGEMTKGYQVVRQNVESFVSQIMQNMGLPVHLKGFTYVRSAVLILYRGMEVAQMPMKQVYKEIARTHGSTVSRVEKTIRTSIDYAYRITPQLIAVRGEKPTNSQLIHLICERVLLRELEQKSEELA